MALELIGRRYGVKVLDIHTGGVDLIFPHHEDEIAQSCAYTGESEFARVWMHAAFLRVRGTKMSKRFGNITTARDLRQDGIEPGAIRLLVYQTHYRQELDLTDEALAAAREGSRRLGEFARRLEAAASVVDDAGFLEAAEQLERGFVLALNEDLNAPRAVAEVFSFVSAANRLLDQGHHPGKRALQAWNFADGVLDAATVPQVYKIQLQGPASATEFAEAPPEDPATQAAWAQHWADRRRVAKGKRDFSEADRIRALLSGHGWQVRDLKDGGSEVSRS
jgi:cysteinyl-tRNA synthetase